MRLTVYLLYAAVFASHQMMKSPWRIRKDIFRGPIKLSDRHQWLSYSFESKTIFWFWVFFSNWEYQNGRNCVNHCLRFSRERERESSGRGYVDGTRGNPMAFCCFVVFLLGQLGRFQVSALLAFGVYSLAEKESLAMCMCVWFSGSFNRRVERFKESRALDDVVGFPFI